MQPRRLFLIPLLTLALLPAACGGDDEEEVPAGGAAGPAETATATPEPTPKSTDTDVKPSIKVPEGEPPSELVVEDLVEGDGRKAKAGDTLSMQYVGVSYSTGQEFDASWDRGEPFTFQLGAGMVIPGWDKGIKGMKEGGRRRLVIPPDLAYGEAGSPPAIAPGETLIFVVDLVEIA